MKRGWGSGAWSSSRRRKAFTCTPVPLADAAYLRFGDAAGTKFHHNGAEILVDPKARLEPVGKEAALPQLLLHKSLAAMGWPG